MYKNTEDVGVCRFCGHTKICLNLNSTNHNVVMFHILAIYDLFSGFFPTHKPAFWAGPSVRDDQVAVLLALFHPRSCVRGRGSRA